MYVGEKLAAIFQPAENSLNFNIDTSNETVKQLQNVFRKTDSTTEEHHFAFDENLFKEDVVDLETQTAEVKVNFSVNKIVSNPCC